MRDEITIRESNDADAGALLRLAALDDRPALRGPAMLAFVGGELAAARTLEGGTAVADPFRRTAHLLDMLALQSETLRARGRA